MLPWLLGLKSQETGEKELALNLVALFFSGTRRATDSVNH